MRAAIVNDLSLAREVLRRVILSSGEHSIAWTAKDGREAIELASRDRPDVILMDLVMPGVDGVEATRRIMAESPCPILLVTSSVASNFSKVFQAISHGGLDAVNIPTLLPDGSLEGSERILRRLDQLRTVSQASVCKVKPGLALGLKTRAERAERQGPPLVALGASVGGPDALARVVAGLPDPFPAGVIIIQHIASEYTSGLAEWLQQHTTLRVELARAGERVQAGKIYLAHTDDHLVINASLQLRYTAEPAGCPYRPSVDALFCSLAAHWPGQGVAALLTGMSSDGAEGLCRLRRAGWYTLAQDQATCVVYGMPKAAVELGAASEVLPLSHIAPALVTHVWQVIQGQKDRG